MEIAATEFASSDGAAMEYLATIEGASVDEQEWLFLLVLSIHGARIVEYSKGPLVSSIKPRELQLIADRLCDMVKGWSHAAIRNNASLEDTAHMLWNQLTLLEGKDRVVALGLLLNEAAVPYAQLPGDLALMKPLNEYREAHDCILEKIALLHRVQDSGSISIYELAVSMTKILEQCESAEERVAFMAHFLRDVSGRLSRAEGAKRVVGFIFERMSQVFEQLSHDDEDPDENIDE